MKKETIHQGKENGDALSPLECLVFNIARTKLDSKLAKLFGNLIKKKKKAEQDSERSALINVLTASC